MTTNDKHLQNWLCKERNAYIARNANLIALGAFPCNGFAANTRERNTCYNIADARRLGMESRNPYNTFMGYNSLCSFMHDCSYTDSAGNLRFANG